MPLKNTDGNRYSRNGKKSKPPFFQENYFIQPSISGYIMKDKRIENLAQILIDYSLQIKPHDILMINGSSLATPLIKETYKLALKRGAHPHIRLGISDLVEYFYKNASDQQLTYVSPISEFETKTITAQLSIISQENTCNLTNVDPEKQAQCSVAHQHLQQLFLKRAAKKDLRWCITQYPTNAAAQDAQMSLEEYENFVFKAAHIQKKIQFNTGKPYINNKKSLEESSKQKRRSTYLEKILTSAYQLKIGFGLTAQEKKTSQMEKYSPALLKHHLTAKSTIHSPSITEAMKLMTSPYGSKTEKSLKPQPHKETPFFKLC